MLPAVSLWYMHWNHSSWLLMVMWCQGFLTNNRKRIKTHESEKKTIATAQIQDHPFYQTCIRGELCGPEVHKSMPAYWGPIARSAAAPKSDTLNQINKNCICCRSESINAKQALSSQKRKQLLEFLANQRESFTIICLMFDLCDLMKKKQPVIYKPLVPLT